MRSVNGRCRRKRKYTPELFIIICLNVTTAVAGIFGIFLYGRTPARTALRNFFIHRMHLAPTSVFTTRPASTPLCLARRPRARLHEGAHKNRQMSSSSKKKKNSSSSSSAEPKLVKSTLYLNRPPMPPNPLTNCAPSYERFVTNSRFAPDSFYFSSKPFEQGQWLLGLFHLKTC